uniref:Uncharacterized protein n=1 Tax=Arundo donax TaxID=35708 RepID=A0A0A9DYC2_ARUDO
MSCFSTWKAGAHKLGSSKSVSTACGPEAMLFPKLPMDPPSISST